MIYHRFCFNISFNFQDWQLHFVKLREEPVVFTSVLAICDYFSTNYTRYSLKLLYISEKHSTKHGSNTC